MQSGTGIACLADLSRHSFPAAAEASSQRRMPVSVLPHHAAEIPLSNASASARLSDKFFNRDSGLLRATPTYSEYFLKKRNDLEKPFAPLRCVRPIPHFGQGGVPANCANGFWTQCQPANST